MLRPVSKVPTQWGECYFNHFERHLGNPVSRNRFEQNDFTPRIQIIGYDGVFTGCRAFCSFGLSHYPEQIGEVAEVFMPVDESWGDTPLILASTLFYIVQHQMFMGQGTVIRFSDVHTNFAFRFSKTAIYFAEPFGVPEDFKQVNCGSEIGHIYLACYISEAEYCFRTNNGAEKFEALLEEKQVDVFHIRRESCI